VGLLTSRRYPTDFRGSLSA